MGVSTIFVHEWTRLKNQQNAQKQPKISNFKHHHKNQYLTA
jgi:hypothetical protein